MARNQAAVPVKLSKLKLVKDKIMVTDMSFEHRVTTAGIILPDDDMEQRGIRPRWGRVIAVGPEQTEVEVGEWVYVAHGRWTRGVDIFDEETEQEVVVRLVDPEEIYLKAPEPLKDEFVREKLGLEGGV